ncbi:MAG: trigger factor [Planctomycetes bacterium]|nr:trigger factor [Planctomycetota bacterium]MBI3844553.1 trigger factor [Planctomycetota bacterium]
MEAVVEEIGPCRKLLKITVSGERVSQEVNKTFQQIIQSSNFPGFRKGHVPRKFLERKYGERIYHDIKRDLIASSFEEAMSEKKITALGSPEIDIEKVPFDPSGPLYFEITIEVRPDFDLPSYKGLAAIKEPVSVVEQEVDAAMKSFAKSRATLEPLSPAEVTPDDVVIADCEVARGDQKIGANENVQFVPSEEKLLGLRVPGLGARFTGAQALDPCEFEVELPQSVEIAGERGGKATLRIVPREVKRLKVPTVDDRWAKELDFDSLDQLRDNVKSQVQQSKERDAWRAVEDRILDQLLDKTRFDVPKSIVQKEMERAFHRARVQMQMDGLAEDEILQRLETQRDRREEEMERAFKKVFILERIAEAEHIFVTEEQMTEALASIAQSYGKWPNEVRAYFEENNLLPQLRSEIRERLTREFLRNNATIEERSIPRVR